MNIRIPTLLVLATLCVASSAFACGLGIGGEKITMLQQRALPDAPGKNALVFTVEYMPGQQSVPHMHGGSVVAYVFERCSDLAARWRGTGHLHSRSVLVRNAAHRTLGVAKRQHHEAGQAPGMDS